VTVPARSRGWLLIAVSLVAAGCGHPLAAHVDANTPQRGADAPPSEARELPPATGSFDYQLGSAYDVAGLAVVVRDETAQPLAGAYNICYVNGFQTQPGDDAWLEHRGTAVLRDADGSPVVDPDWPDEFVLDPSTPAQRDVILGAVGPLIASCAAKGFDAVELDNFDTLTRFQERATGRIDERGAFELAQSYVSLAHAENLAIGQKNAAEWTERGRREIGFDFAVAEECATYGECARYTRVYGAHVLQVEYTDNLPEPFAAVCASPDRAPQTILRDRELVARGTDGYAYDQCR
jgi:hypothetical protein